MFKKIEEYKFFDIYKHINAGVYIAAINGEKIATGNYMNVKNSVDNYWNRFFSTSEYFCGFKKHR